MPTTINTAEHKLGWAEGAKPFRDGESFDITGTAKVEISGKTCVLFICGDAEVDLYDEVAEEVWIWGNATLRVHVKCTVRASGGTVYCEVPDALIIAEKRSVVHAEKGVHVRGYTESQIHAPQGTDVTLSGWSLWHLPDGTVRGNTDTYRPGYCLSWCR
jgi:hypothetical protein